MTRIKRIIASAMALTMLATGASGFLPANNTLTASAVTTTAKKTTKETVKKTERVSISKASVSLSTTSYVYTSANKKAQYTPTVKVTHSYWGNTLKEGTDYTVSYKNNTKHGIASVVIKGKGNYTGTKTVHFYIYQKIEKTKKVSATAVFPMKMCEAIERNEMPSIFSKATFYIDGVKYTGPVYSGKYTSTQIKGEFKAKSKKGTIINVKTSTGPGEPVEKLPRTNIQIKLYDGKTLLKYESPFRALYAFSYYISPGDIELKLWNKAVLTYNNVKMTKTVYKCGSKTSTRVKASMKDDNLNYFNVTSTTPLPYQK